MHLFRNRRRYHPRTGRLSPLSIVLICVIATVLLTIITGNLLKAWLDDETYRQLTDETEPEETASPPIHTSPVRDIWATPFVFGQSIDDVWEFPDVSTSLNTPDGRLNYSSSVAEYFSVQQNETVLFGDAIGDLKGAAAYIAGVFYPQAFDEENPELLYAATLRDTAIIHEFLQAGGSDILLCNLPFGVFGINDILSYVQTVKEAVPNHPVGICVPVSQLQKNDAWKTLSRLLEQCDFCAIDMTGADSSKTADEWISFFSYYLQQYDMRLVISEAQPELIKSAKNLANVQVITHYSITEDSEESHNNP